MTAAVESWVESIRLSRRHWVPEAVRAAEPGLIRAMLDFRAAMAELTDAADLLQPDQAERKQAAELAVGCALYDLTH